MTRFSGQMPFHPCFPPDSVSEAKKPTVRISALTHYMLGQAVALIFQATRAEDPTPALREARRLIESVLEGGHDANTGPRIEVGE